MAGHRRYLQGTPRFNAMKREALAALAKGQQPYATILGCADSRVPPEVIFDAGPGELFVIRVAGNVLSAEVAGQPAVRRHASADAAVHRAGPRGVRRRQGRARQPERGIQHHSRIQILVDSILPAMEQVDCSLPPEAQLAQAVEANVRGRPRRRFTNRRKAGCGRLRAG